MAYQSTVFSHHTFLGICFVEAVSENFVRLIYSNIYEILHNKQLVDTPYKCTGMHEAHNIISCVYKLLNVKCL